MLASNLSAYSLLLLKKMKLTVYTGKAQWKYMKLQLLGHQWCLNLVQICSGLYQYWMTEWLSFLWLSLGLLCRCLKNTSVHHTNTFNLTSFNKHRFHISWQYNQLNLLSQALRCFSVNSNSSGVLEPGLRLLKRISPWPPWPCSIMASRMVRLFLMSTREDLKMSSFGWNAARIRTFWLAPIIIAIESLCGWTPSWLSIAPLNLAAALSGFFYN